MLFTAIFFQKIAIFFNGSPDADVSSNGAFGRQDEPTYNKVSHLFLIDFFSRTATPEIKTYPVNITKYQLILKLTHTIFVFRKSKLN